MTFVECSLSFERDWRIADRLRAYLNDKQCIVRNLHRLYVLNRTIIGGYFIILICVHYLYAVWCAVARG